MTISENGQLLRLRRTGRSRLPPLQMFPLLVLQALGGEALEVMAVLDASGSMQQLAADTIGGFNSFLLELQQLKKHVQLSLVVFNTHETVLYEHANVLDAQPLTKKTYRPSGGTALLDALGAAIVRTRAHLEQLPAGERPDVQVFVSTDGAENSSREYSREAVKQLVSECSALGWKFVFAGANMDAVEAGKSIGFAAENIANVHNDGAAQHRLFKAAAKTAAGAAAASFQDAYDREL